MPRASYEYGTSPRKYEPEYTPSRTTTKRQQQTTRSKQATVKKSVKAKSKKVQEKTSRLKQLVIVIGIFGMLLAVSYREISIMEMFNQKKDMENKLATIEKENGQVEKDIKEVESTLDWNKINQVAKDELGMQAKDAIPINLEKSDNVEKSKTYIKEDNTSILEKIIGYFVK